MKLLLNLTRGSGQSDSPACSTSFIFPAENGEPLRKGRQSNGSVSELDSTSASWLRVRRQPIKSHFTRLSIDVMPVSVSSMATDGSKVVRFATDTLPTDVTDAANTVKPLQVSVPPRSTLTTDDNAPRRRLPSTGRYASEPIQLAVHPESADHAISSASHLPRRMSQATVIDILDLACKPAYRTAAKVQDDQRTFTSSSKESSHACSSAFLPRKSSRNTFGFVADHKSTSQQAFSTPDSEMPPVPQITLSIPDASANGLAADGRLLHLVVIDVLRHPARRSQVRS